MTWEQNMAKVRKAHERIKGASTPEEIVEIYKEVEPVLVSLREEIDSLYEVQVASLRSISSSLEALVNAARLKIFVRRAK